MTTIKTRVPKKKAAPKPKREANPASKGKYYINKKDLLAAVIQSKEDGKMSDQLAAYLHLLTAKYAKSSQYIGYPFNDDMQGYALMMLVRTWNGFDPSRSENPNPFAFYTQCIKNSFNQFLNKEKAHRNVRDALLVNQGLSPSYTYQAEYKERMDEAKATNYDEEDHYSSMEAQNNYDTEGSSSNTDDFYS